MSTPFTVYAGASNSNALTDVLFAPGSGITANSVVLKASGPDAVNLYDGSLAALGIGGGLLLTSGTTPGTSNTVDWFGTDNSGTSGFTNGDADIDAVVNTVFQTQSYDATTLEFDFTVADMSATSVSFDLVFGSDEYPEWVDQFVDSAIVMVNGVNYALFNHDAQHTLSVVSSNLAAGYFQDNAGNGLPVEYDGVSHVLKIVAPINAGGAGNHIKIGIADTGDHIYDSGIFLANFTAGTIPGSGVVSTPTTGTAANDDLTGTAQAEYFDLKGGDDRCYAGAGDDIVVAGSGNDSVYGGSGADQLKGDAGNDALDGGADTDTAVFAGASSQYVVAAVGGGFTVTDTASGAPEGADTLTDIERLKFSDGLFAIGAGGVLTPVANPATAPANTAGSVVISGVGALGKVVTATVSDPDGVAGAVSYQWQVSGADGGWIDVGSDSNSYTVLAADLGKEIQVVATYTDTGTHLESPVSAAKTIQQTGDGDLVVTLMQLDAPAGASSINPLTTLVRDAIALGLSPNQAAQGIKAVLGLPDGINLQSYDAYAVLQGSPGDPSALAVEKVAVQVAILTSLSDDDLGTNLSLKIIEAGAIQQTLDLADATDLAAILGLDTAAFDISDRKTYPEPLREIFDRNDNIAQAGDVGGIEAQWQDFLSIQDFVASNSIADLNIHVNQAPTGSAAASLVNGLEDAAYTVSASDLLAGFSDSDGGTLSVSGLSADKGTVTDNGDGMFTISPPAGYNGPVELSYTVLDGQVSALDGQVGSAPASQLFVIAPGPVTPPVNTPPTGTASAVLADGTEDSAYIVSALDLLAGFSDVDGADVLAVASLGASDGVALQKGDGSWTITPGANFNGAVTLNYTVTDGHGGSVGGTQGYSLAPVNDAPVLANPIADQALAQGPVFSYVVPIGAFTDVDDATLVYSATLAGGQPLPTWLNFNPSTRSFLGTPSPADLNSLTVRVTATDAGNASVHDDFTLVIATGQTVSGTSGDDTLPLALGNGSVNGGAGMDPVILPMFPDVFNLTGSAGQVSGSYGTGTPYTLALNDVELARFGSFHQTTIPLGTLVSGEAQFQLGRLTDLYLAFFGRAPDVSGLEFWQEQLLEISKDFTAISKDFAWSPEAQALFPQTGSNRDFVHTVYANCFGREPDAGGWDYWTGVLDAQGVTDLSDRGVFVGNVILGAYATSSGPEDRTLMTNRHEAALYYVNKLAIDLAEGFDVGINALLARVTGDTFTEDKAERVIDHVFANPVTLSGVMNDPALLDSIWGA